MRPPFLLAVGLAVLAVALLVAATRLQQPASQRGAVAATPPPATVAPTDPPTATSPPAATTPPAARPTHPLVDRSTVGAPWGTVRGLLQFRGNPTHTFYGTGPVPASPEVVWRYPDRPMCTEERVGGSDEQPQVKRWCGSGWTGQPVVWERPDGRTEVIVGTYDRAVHFIDAATGAALRPPFRTGDIIKGSVTLDPDGFPLLYTGSRDGHLRVIALDRATPTELWALPANRDRVWNNDWDGNPSVVDGILLEGGEDSWFYAIELNRGYDADGRVEVRPEILVSEPGWTSELFERLGDRNVSFESSVAVFEGRAYLANSGGRVVGYDLSRVREGVAPVVFDYWMGDDVDASIVVDAEGMLYVTAELERRLPRAAEVGQLVKLDPYTDGDPRVWGLDIPGRPPSGGPPDAGGSWSTPALHRGHLYLTTHAGDLLVVDASDGEVVHEERIGYHEWSSPAVVDDTLIVGACQEAGLVAYDVRDPTRPVRRWDVPLGGCVESTPAVWGGGIYVGSRDGYIYGVADR